MWAEGDLTNISNLGGRLQRGSAAAHLAPRFSPANSHAEEIYGATKLAADRLRLFELNRCSSAVIVTRALIVRAAARLFKFETLGLTLAGAIDTRWRYSKVDWDAFEPQKQTLHDRLPRIRFPKLVCKQG